MHTHVYIYAHTCIHTYKHTWNSHETNARSWCTQWVPLRRAACFESYIHTHINTHAHTHHTHMIRMQVRGARGESLFPAQQDGLLKSNSVFRWRFFVAQESLYEVCMRVRMCAACLVSTVLYTRMLRFGAKHLWNLMPKVMNFNEFDAESHELMKFDAENHEIWRIMFCSFCKEL